MQNDEFKYRSYLDALDAFDEELEIELDDEDVSFADLSEGDKQERQRYFKELFRLQGELVKLQDWVVHQKLKIVVIFEGRDAAGKGGAIKRITQRLNPRVCRVAALPAPCSSGVGCGGCRHARAPGSRGWCVDANADAALSRRYPSRG
jgi:polyphosphate kinase 2 (PPK2 family)